MILDRSFMLVVHTKIFDCTVFMIESVAKMCIFALEFQALSV